MNPNTTDVYIQSFVCVLLIAVVILFAHTIAASKPDIRPALKANSDRSWTVRKYTTPIVKGPCVLQRSQQTTRSYHHIL